MSLLHNDNLGFLIADVSRLLRRSFEQSLEGSTLTLAQARALIYVARREGCRQVELAELLEVQPITLARLIDQLVAAGLVERRADPSDRRAYRLFLTAAAAPQLQAIEQTAALIRGAALAGLDQDQVAALLAALGQVRSNLCGA
ncbi:MarR family winged helix-turn-helix transcriptional regulator [Pseudomonas sp. GCM10022188]|uniref:MarR family winged helix-turn-helix transcriptional regulator n=1 Tax=Pseudomonas TaxID=286 RepID=UPI001E358047|nr:MarR family transcriptional regulator [Pseudomonas oryzagri]MCC6075649.1 MarR family transcriptional regulator [Pseudomonas oryzagri]